jgi:iron complex transport system ATP-binding protein
VIDARDLRIDIGGRMLLDEMTFAIERGEFVGILGPNGVGKTTLLRTLAGALRVARGTLRLDGSDISALASVERARRIAFVTSDDAPLDDVRVRDVAATGRYPFHRWWQWNATAQDVDAVDAALRAVGMEAFADRRFATLSSGERQRVWLALALAQEAPLLLLDEPTSHLDVRVAHEILQLLKEQARSGKTVVCAIHDLNDAAAYADRLMLLGSERMLGFDEPDRVMTGGLLEEAYGIAMETVRSPSGALRVFARIPS